MLTLLIFTELVKGGLSLRPEFSINSNRLAACLTQSSSLFRILLRLRQSEPLNSARKFYIGYALLVSKSMRKAESIDNQAHRLASSSQMITL